LQSPALAAFDDRAECGALLCYESLRQRPTRSGPLLAQDPTKLVQSHLAGSGFVTLHQRVERGDENPAVTSDPERSSGIS
jgi:hypothetical protein